MFGCDYIHTSNLCSVHWRATQRLVNSNKSYRYNLGNGEGFSVQEVIDVCKKVTGENIKVIDGERRHGDPAILVANAKLAEKTLVGWRSIQI